MNKQILSCLLAMLLSGCYSLNQEHYNSVVETPDQIESLQKNDDEMRQDIKSLKDALSQLKGNMHTEISQNSVAIQQVSSSSIQVVLQQSLMFRSGSSIISSDGKQALVQFAKSLRSAPDSAKLRIIGHSDNRPVGTTLRSTFKDNWELSSARAAAVARYLIWGEKVAPKRLHIEASAGTQPIASNTTEAGRAANRRIELLIETI